jgi:hypothetical protein
VCLKCSAPRCLLIKALPMKYGSRYESQQMKYACSSFDASLCLKYEP